MWRVEYIKRFLYEETTEFARLKIRWYCREAEKRSKVVHGWSFALGVIGALFPLVEETGAFPNVSLTAWGYVLLAMVGGFSRLIRSLDTPPTPVGA